MTSSASKLQRYSEKEENDKESKSEMLYQRSHKISKTVKQTQNMASIGSDDQNIFSELEKEPHRNFTQICQVESYRKSDKCQICTEAFQQILKSSKNCQFCGKCVCKDCSKRTRRDPQNEENQVRICDLCHYQILYKRIVESFILQKQEKEKWRNELNEECEKKKEELYKKQKMNEEIKLQTQQQRLKYGQLLDEKKGVLSEIRDNQKKNQSDHQAVKEKISKLQKETQEQEKELTQLRATYYQLHEHKKNQEMHLNEKEEEFRNVQSKYETIQKDIDKKKFQSQTQDATDLFEEHPRSKSAMRYQSSIIDYNHINSSVNGNSNSSINNQKKKQSRKQKDKDQTAGFCNQKSCSIF